MSENDDRVDIQEPKTTSEKGQAVIDTHEKFMREANKQMVESLAQVEKDVKVIRAWVLFFGIMAIIGLVLGGCNMLMSF